MVERWLRSKSDDKPYLRDLAFWLDVPISSEEIDEVTAKYNAASEAIAQLDESLWRGD